MTLIMSFNGELCAEYIRKEQYYSSTVRCRGNLDDGEFFETILTYVS